MLTFIPYEQVLFINAATFARKHMLNRAHTHAHMHAHTEPQVIIMADYLM